jgi:hypothetical protein
MAIEAQLPHRLITRFAPKIRRFKKIYREANGGRVVVEEARRAARMEAAQREAARKEAARREAAYRERIERERRETTEAAQSLAELHA